MATLNASAAKAEAGSSFSKRPVAERAGTDEMSSQSLASSGHSSSGQYEVIEYEESEEIELPDVTPAIEDNTPAAEALRANANVRVSRMVKVARATNIQTVRKLVKRATLTTRSGIARGKPPRIPDNDDEDSSEDEGLEPINEESEQTSERPDLPEDADDIHPDTVVAGTVEAGKKVLRAVDPHDVLRLLRWRKKKKGNSQKLKPSYVKGKVIDGEHELYTLSIAVMIGVRTSISRTNTVLNSGSGKRWIQPQDFRKTEKYEFRPKGGTATPPHRLSHTFKFKDYSPLVFAYIRRMYGVNEFDFLLSVCGNANFIEFISNAKSGQFFFYSSDGKYMIKTMTNAECKFLRKMLPHYFRHCAENPNTLITRFLGMYRVKLYHLRRNVKFIIMNSVYYTDRYLQSFYDLKGSVHGRDAKPGQAVKKDNDLRRGLPDEALAFLPETRKRVRDQMVRDCKFMEKMGIMDYSMLVGVHHIPPEGDDNSIATVGIKGARKSGRTRKNSLNHGAGGAPSSASHARNLSDIIDPDLLKNISSDKVELQQRSNSMGNFFYDDSLDDDDNSYLFGSDQRDAENSRCFDEETEAKTQSTIEKLYWPFHNLYDIHGYRRLEPPECCKSNQQPNDHTLQGFKIPNFVPPLSDRKDGGFDMDTTGLTMPMVLKTPKGNQLYEGKIFYLGIIDILQEFNSRKLVETNYRYVQLHHRSSASCVPPKRYGERFIEFFDEYSQRGDKKGKQDGND